MEKIKGWTRRESADKLKGEWGIGILLSGNPNVRGD